MWATLFVIHLPCRAAHIARLAQSAERKAFSLVVVGSSPTVGVSSLWSCPYMSFLYLDTSVAASTFCLGRVATKLHAAPFGNSPGTDHSPVHHREWWAAAFGNPRTALADAPVHDDTARNRTRDKPHIANCHSRSQCYSQSGKAGKIRYMDNTQAAHARQLA